MPTQMQRMKILESTIVELTKALTAMARTIDKLEKRIAALEAKPKKKAKKKEE